MGLLSPHSAGAGLAASPPPQPAADVFRVSSARNVHLTGGVLGARILVNERARLLHVDENDMLDCYENRDGRHQVWQGEHVGKFLHAAVLAWFNTGDPALKAKIERVAQRLMETQETDGYLGTYPDRDRWTNWDVWTHKYVLIGLLSYWHMSHDPEALKACRRVGDLLVSTFGDGPGQLDINRAGEHVGMAATSVLEPMLLLYHATRDARYFDFARYIVRHYDAPTGPAILTSLRTYHSVHRVANGKAYEMLSNFNGLLELYRITGDKSLLDAIRIAWTDVVAHHLYITGSASTFECFPEDYHLPNNGAADICETCVTVTWEQVNRQLLRLTGDPIYADELERSIYNHLLGAQKPTGEAWSYYTPLEGHKPYSPSTSCCLSSGPRGIALIPTFAVMASADGGVVVNLYNSGEATLDLPHGSVTLTQRTEYPLRGDVLITVSPRDRSARFPVRLRIPAWTKRAAASVNGHPIPASSIRPGAYLKIDRTWRPGDRIALKIDLTPRLVMGDHENAGKAAIMVGPMVLALDTAYGLTALPLRHFRLPSDRIADLGLKPSDRSRSGEPVYTARMLLDRAAAAPSSQMLTPYAWAGQNGKSAYEVWIRRAASAPLKESLSLLYGCEQICSRVGNVDGDITDDDFGTFRVTFNGARADEDWFGAVVGKPVEIRRVVFGHGRTFHDGGWFDTKGGTEMPRVQVRTSPDGPWTTVATLATYPKTTSGDCAGLSGGERFEAALPPVKIYAVRVIGKPASGDNPLQAFSSCSEIQAF
jgi:DUF1680 family protein